MAILALLFEQVRPKKTHPGGENMNNEQPIPAEQKTTAQELIAANIKALIEQLEAGNSDALTAYLDAMSRFHRYSFGNVLSIARQRPGAGADRDRPPQSEGAAARNTLTLGVHRG
jgi:hypothetical protein